MFDECMNNVFESSIDYPRKNLDLQVWNQEGDEYTLRPEVKDAILDFLDKYPDRDIVDLAEEEDGVPRIHIVGSIATNQYSDDADIDVHVVVDPEDDIHGDEDYQSQVKDWFEDNRDELDGYIGKHPIEVYLQYDPNQDLLSDGAYSIMNDEWLAGPTIVPEDFDPYEEYSDIMDDIRDAVEDADLLMGELKRDVVDYEVIQSAMEEMSDEQKTALKDKLNDKLEKIEDTIEDLYSKRKEWVDLRREASKPASPEQAKKDAELVKKWKDTNALFKFISRYHYLRVIKDLNNLLSDDQISDDEVDVIRGIMGAKDGS